MWKRLTKNKECGKQKTSGIAGSLYKTRPFTHFGKTFMGKGLGERAITNN